MERCFVLQGSARADKHNEHWGDKEGDLKRKAKARRKQRSKVPTARNTNNTRRQVDIMYIEPKKHMTAQNQFFGSIDHFYSYIF